MAALESLSYLMGIDTHTLRHKEKILFEAELFTHICEELKEEFRKKHKDYFYSIKFANEKENLMLEARLVQDVIQDILSTDEYNLKGIAYYTDSFEEVVEEFATGINTNPSAIFLRKLILLHLSVRRELYNYIKKKLQLG